MNPETEPEKWQESANYRQLLSAMSKVRWNVAHNRHRRPDGTQDIKLLMERLAKFVAEDNDVDYVIQLNAVSQFVRMPIHELRYLAEVGKWIETDRTTQELTDEEYDEYWGKTEAPSSSDRYSMMADFPSDSTLYEVSSLNELFYGSSYRR